ncbi:hypothetical protein RRG08_010779 [Elysia crispata]|uniref:C-type lectin domain-containing protein n=1 Tax=Elysia crispata TaxID=231223 RepID=A0AAE1A9V1_9GAST|nr:hypothetical protein RRG08_010779 [Elysia crispata]
MPERKHHFVGDVTRSSGTACKEQEYLLDYQCPQAGWEWLKGTCVYFSIPSERKSWTDARAACRAKHRQADLVILPNDDLRQELFTFASSPKTMEHWIGLRSTSSSGIHSWINGSVQVTSNTSLQAGCQWLSKSGFHVADCMDVKGFICQRERDLSPYRHNEDAELELTEGKNVPFGQLQSVFCDGYHRMDRDLCLYWIYGNETFTGIYSLANCGESGPESKLVHYSSLEYRYIKENPAGPCIRKTYTYIEFFSESMDIFDGIMLSCCKKEYNDTWKGYQPRECSLPVTMHIDRSRFLKPDMRIKWTDPFVGYPGSFGCHGPTHRDLLISLGWLDKAKVIQWVYLHHPHRDGESFGMMPRGMVVDTVHFFEELRYSFITFDVHYTWYYDKGFFVCWLGNFSGLVNTTISLSDPKAVFSQIINMHYAPRKPVLELISQDDLVVNAKCRTIIGSYETSKTLWGIYLSTTYLDLFTINYNMEMDLRRSSDFRVKQIDVWNHTTDGPIIESYVALHLPSYFRNGTLFCYSALLPDMRLLKRTPEPFDFWSYVTISYNPPGDGRRIALILVRLITFCFMMAPAALGIYRLSVTFCQKDEGESTNELLDTIL